MRSRSSRSATRTCTECEFAPTPRYGNDTGSLTTCASYTYTDARNLSAAVGETLKPALEVLACVQSQPEPGLALRVVPRERRAELGAQTRVRLERMSAQRHELLLERGRMHARVSAPPRIFAVATPLDQSPWLATQQAAALNGIGE